MPDQVNTQFRVASQYKSILREAGLDGPALFSDERVVAWRTLPDRQNCTLDVDLADGRHVRWHVKRFNQTANAAGAIEDEVRGHSLLTSAGIATAPMVGYGTVPGFGSVVISEDLDGYRPADKLVEAGAPFATLLLPTAELAASLHAAGLHHRDLYLCHFMARTAGDTVDVRLIDTARVKRLPGRLTRSRWIVKDLAQFWYSTLKLAVTGEQRVAWLKHYADRTGAARIDALQRRVERKSRSIARHDARLHRLRPERDVSLPT